MSHCCHHTSGAKPTDILTAEHNVIKRMIAVLNRAVDRLEGGEQVSPEVFRKAADFIRNFADKCHHMKEQDTLFPTLVQRGMPQEDGPIGVMLIEHDRGRAFTKGMAEATESYAAGDQEAKKAIIANARGFGELLIQHIDKEDNVLYVMANNLLTDSDQAELLEKFEVAEASMGEGTHEKYIALVEELEKAFGE
ncbi:MAG: hemerythrin [Armatimonadetes bacterium]|nr:hemerythrin [Armatimonadota bacterium]PIY44045.1 MAG: hemerythrin [Armatimonadetes bacterium CG_4_10_14_3_um_filter_59_10]PJB76062.1 MAG: hemerythrin [Armatimonadetes bacterium CG_4_9_14_3_um_filter_58_7]